MNSHNGELLGAYGNFVNRSLTFIQKYQGGRVPEGTIDFEWNQIIEQLYQNTAARIEQGDIKDALSGIFEQVRAANKYFDTESPWITRNTDLSKCNQTLFNYVQIIANFAVLLHPFLPFSSEKVLGWLKIDTQWSKKFIPVGQPIPEISLLFERLDKSVIKIEEEKLSIIC